MKLQKKGFTLIEMIIAISIFSVIMISIMSVYFIANDITYKSYLNRIIHENTKNVIMNISEDVMKNEIIGASDIFSTCKLPSEDESYIKGIKFCTSFGEYYLAKKSLSGEDYTITDSDFCSDRKNECYIVRNGVPLTNNLVSVTDLRFVVTNEKIRKVTISITLKSSTKSGVKPSMIEKSELKTQITLSERKYKN